MLEMKKYVRHKIITIAMKTITSEFDMFIYPTVGNHIFALRVG
jgi:hypothetical protein